MSTKHQASLEKTTKTTTRSKIRGSYIRGQKYGLRHSLTDSNFGIIFTPCSSAAQTTVKGTIKITVRLDLATFSVLTLRRLSINPGPQWTSPYQDNIKACIESVLLGIWIAGCYGLNCVPLKFMSKIPVLHNGDWVHEEVIKLKWDMGRP